MQFRMQYSKAGTIGCLLVGAALAQTEDGLRSRISNVHYPPLAESARVQGDVRLKLNSGVVELVSGHPLLARLAIENAKTFGSIQGQANLDVTYHFVIVDTAISVPTSRTVKRSNALGRVVLRALGCKTERVVRTYECKEDVAPASDIKIDGAVVDVWVYGRTRCLETNTTTLVAKR
jgi:hypothetical protein